MSKGTRAGNERRVSTMAKTKRLYRRGRTVTSERGNDESTSVVKGKKEKKKKRNRIKRAYGVSRRA